MIRTALLPVVGIVLAAASPRSVDPTLPMPSFTTQAPVPAPDAPPPPGYTTAPTPNDYIFTPTTQASKDASLAPGFFSRRDQYRGEGISPGSSAQTEQDRRAKPGAGISLRMPLQ